MPWQQYVVDVALELDPDTNRFVYPEIGLTVPRQSGKSTLLLCKAVHRATAVGFFGSRQRIVYTAQTRHKAREKWEEDFVGDLEASRYFAPRVKVGKSNGNEHIRFPSGSRFGIEANTEKAGHGPTLDEAYIDEAFAHSDTRLEQAFRPAMITRRNKQLWWVSTAGWKGGSPYLEDKVAKGRLAVRTNRRTGLAYFEWSSPGAGEEGFEPEDPYDPETWWRCMPALGWTIEVDDIAAELIDLGLIDFMRAYLNRWVPKNAVPEWSVVTEADWLNREIAPERPVGPVMFAVASAYPDAQETAVVVVGQTERGRIAAQVLKHAAGVSWAVARAEAAHGFVAEPRGRDRPWRAGGAADRAVDRCERAARRGRDAGCSSCLRSDRDGDRRGPSPVRALRATGADSRRFVGGEATARGRVHMGEEGQHRPFPD